MLCSWQPGQAFQAFGAAYWLGTMQFMSPSSNAQCGRSANPSVSLYSRAPYCVHTSRLLAQLGLVARVLASQQPVGSLVDGYHIAAGLRALPKDVLLISAPTSRFSLAAPVRPPAHERCGSAWWTLLLALPHSTLEPRSSFVSHYFMD